MKICNILVPFVICAGLSFAQQPAPRAGDAHGEAKAMTGCLMKGAAMGEYMLTMENGEQMRLMSATDISKHVDHKVKVTGAASKKDEKMVFRVDAIEHIAESCK